MRGIEFPANGDFGYGVPPGVVRLARLGGAALGLSRNALTTENRQLSVVFGPGALHIPNTIAELAEGPDDDGTSIGDGRFIDPEDPQAPSDHSGELTAAAI